MKVSTTANNNTYAKPRIISMWLKYVKMLQYIIVSSCELLLLSVCLCVRKSRLQWKCMCVIIVVRQHEGILCLWCVLYVTIVDWLVGINNWLDFQELVWTILWLLSLNCEAYYCVKDDIWTCSMSFSTGYVVMCECVPNVHTRVS